MSSRFRSEPPRLDLELVERWPKPAEVRGSRWRRMSTRQRERWLLDHTYEQTDAGWRRRGDTNGSRTADMVDHAVVTTEGAHELVLIPLVEDLKRSYPEEFDGFGRSEGRSGAFYTALLLAVLVFAVIIWALTAAVVGGGDDAPDAASPPSEITVDTDDGDGGLGPIPATATPSASETQASEASTDSDEPVALTDAPWRFFRSEAEELALYDFVFSEDGTFIEQGAPQNHGTYTVDSSAVTLELTRNTTLMAGDVAHDVTWNEWFAMTREGNTMTGSWTQTDWFLDSDGFVDRGPMEPVGGIFARPELPDDSG